MNKVKEVFSSSPLQLNIPSLWLDLTSNLFFKQKNEIQSKMFNNKKIILNKLQVHFPP